MKKQLIIVCLIILFPSVLYIVLSTGKHNFIRLNYYGPKQALKEKDTLYYSIPPFSFANQSGTITTEKELEGKIYIASFFFTSCQGSSILINNNLQTLQEKFKDRDDVVILSHSVDPGNDSVKVLSAYATSMFAIPGKWIFLTGNKDSIYKAQNFYLQDVEKGDAPLHTENLILIDKEKHIRGMYDGTSTIELNKLMDDIKILIASYEIDKEKEEARNNRKSNNNE